MGSIYGGSRGGWNSLNDVVQPLSRPRDAEPQMRRDAPDWSHYRKAKPADHLLPLTEKWFDMFPPDRAPCALASQYPRICNIIAAQWNDRRGAPELFEELLGDRRGGRAGFPPAVRRDLVMVQEAWYSGALKLG